MTYENFDLVIERTDSMLTEARKAIFAGGREVEWATPVLYLRAPDGRIFDVDRSALRDGAAEPAAPPPQADDEAKTPQQHAARLVREADAVLAGGSFETALERLRQARALDPSAPLLADLTAKAEEQRAVAATRARRRAAFREHLNAASDLLATGNVSAASDRISKAVELRPDDADARALQRRIRQALDRSAKVVGSEAVTVGENPAPSTRPSRPPTDPAQRNPETDVRGNAAESYESDLLDSE
jgi:hypothetical protein